MVAASRASHRNRRRRPRRGRWPRCLHRREPRVGPGRARPAAAARGTARGPNPATLLRHRVDGPTSTATRTRFVRNGHRHTARVRHVRPQRRHRGRWRRGGGRAGGGGGGLRRRLSLPAAAAPAVGSGCDASGPAAASNRNPRGDGLGVLAPQVVHRIVPRATRKKRRCRLTLQL